VEGLPRSRLRDVSRKLTFVPAGHEYHEWQEPRVLTRVVYFYFDPAKMPTYLEAGVAPALWPHGSSSRTSHLRTRRSSSSG
jgi:AraC family transcriptional regulator